MKGSRIGIINGFTLAVCLVSLAVFGLPARCDAAGPQTIVVSAEGLVDANADTYKRDKGIMVDHLREDARRQVIEKAVGVYVESSTITENYTLIRDKVLTRSQGLIKQVIKESPPWVGQDGFGHMLMKAEVYVGQVEEALKEMSRGERVSFIKEYGDPRISVAIMISDAERSSDVESRRSQVAENILKERIKGFGYRVWSEEASEKAKSADFTIVGEAKFKTLAHKLSASGITVKKYALTSWSVKCVDNNTGEEIYFNNKIPKKQTWPDEDVAIEDIGKMIGSEFSKEFFEEHLQASSRVFQLQVLGLPSYDVGEMLKKEFIGLRPVLNVDFRNYDESGVSLYEVEFSGKRGNFNKLVNDTIVKPLNSKLGNNCFKLVSAHGNVVKMSFQNPPGQMPVLSRIEEMPPASIADASPARLKELIKSEQALQRVGQVNPQGVAQMSPEGVRSAEDAKGITRSF